METKAKNNDKKKKKNLQQKSSLLLSTLDTNILQHIFTELIYDYKNTTEQTKFKKEEIKKVFDLIINFKLSCKLFLKISKQPLFPFVLNQIEQNLTYPKYFKILFVIQEVEKDDYFKEKDINQIFYQTCRAGYDDIIHSLIKYDPNINHQQGVPQFTPLLISVYFGKTKVVKILLEQKTINVNQQDKFGNSPLIEAVRYRREEIFKRLITRKDIDINIKDNNGKTALRLATDSKMKKKLKYYEKKSHSLQKENQKIKSSTKD